MRFSRHTGRYRRHRHQVRVGLLLAESTTSGLPSAVAAARLSSQGANATEDADHHQIGTVGKFGDIIDENPGGIATRKPAPDAEAVMRSVSEVDSSRIMALTREARPG